MSVRTFLAVEQTVLQESVEDGPDGPVFLAHLVGLFDLTEDLRLAHDHRVETRGHAEQVPHGVALDHLIGVPIDLFQGQIVLFREETLDRGGTGAGLAGSTDEDLDPVAGRGSSPPAPPPRASKPWWASGSLYSGKLIRSRTATGALR